MYDTFACCINYSSGAQSEGRQHIEIRINNSNKRVETEGMWLIRFLSLSCVFSWVERGLGASYDEFASLLLAGSS